MPHARGIKSTACSVSDPARSLRRARRRHKARRPVRRLGWSRWALAGATAMVFGGLGSIVPTLAAVRAAAATTPVNCSTTNLQTAINAASPGDTLIVTGTCIGNFTIVKNLTLNGQGTAILDGNHSGTVITDDFGATVNLDHLTIRNGNSHNVGGGIFNQGTLTVTDSTISGNTGGPIGGGIFNAEVVGHGAGSLTVIGSTISGNSGGLGGGIANEGSNLTVTASTISGNTTDDQGGGIWNNADASIGATIVAGNTNTFQGGAPDNCFQNFPGIHSVGFNLTNDPSGTACAFTAATDVVGKDPLLGPLANNGGPTQTMLPARSSPAVGVIPNTPTVLNGVTVCGRGATDQRGEPRPIAPSTQCTIGAVEVAPLAGLPPGYWTVASDGGIFSFGDVGFFGSMGGKHLNKPIVGMAATRSGNGYWEVASDGGIFTFGDAGFFGSMGGKPLNKPMVAMATDSATGGYWTVASDGGIFSFNAPFLGSMGGKHLNQPIVGMASTPDGAGYWLVSSDGGIFSFGDAHFHGSMGGKHLNKPIVGMASTKTGGGYWEVASDGGIFTFGDAGFFGSMGGKPLNKPMVAMAADSATGGYWTVASDGGIFAFNAPFLGSMGGKPLNAPMVGMASVG